MLLAKLWYLAFFSSQSVIFPFFPLILRRASLTERQIGFIQALKPWAGLPGGSILSGLADVYRLHKLLSLVSIILSVTIRLGVIAQTTFTAILIMTLLGEFVNAPLCVVVDAAVMAAVGTEGSYARQRLWGAVGWGAFSYVGGTLMSGFGVKAVVMLCIVLSVVTVVPTYLLPMDALNKKLDAKTSSTGGGGGGGGGGGDGHRDDSGDEEECDVVEGAINHRRTATNTPTRGIPEEEAVPLTTDTSRTSIVDSFAEDIDIDSNNECVDIIDPPLHPPQTSNNSSSSSKRTTLYTSSSNNNTTSKTTTATTKRPDMWSGLVELFTNPEAIIFFSIATVYGFCVGNIEGFLFLYLDDLGGSETLMGLTLTWTCIAETAVFYYTGSIVKTLGPNRCLHLIYLAFLIRLLSYSTLAWWPTVWLVLPVELLHGFTFGLTWSVGAAICNRLSPPGLEATTQSIFQGIYFGVGAGIGGLVGGVLYEEVGPQVMYGVASCVLVCGWICTTMAKVYIVGGRKESDVGGGGGGCGEDGVVVYAAVETHE